MFVAGKILAHTTPLSKPCGEILRLLAKPIGRKELSALMLFFTIVVVFAVSAFIAVSTTRALLKFMFSALGHAQKEDLKPRV